MLETTTFVEIGIYLFILWKLSLQNRKNWRQHNYALIFKNVYIGFDNWPHTTK